MNMPIVIEIASDPLFHAESHLANSDRLHPDPFFQQAYAITAGSERHCQTSPRRNEARMQEGPLLGAFLLAALMYFCSGLLMQDHSSADIDSFSRV
jgi:hypothetical protein